MGVGRGATDSQGFCWESSGDGRFSISEHPAAERGTKIVLHLKVRNTGAWGSADAIPDGLAHEGCIASCPLGPDC